VNRFAILASLIVLVVLVLVAVGVPAAVAKATHPGHPVHPADPARPAHGASGSCAAHEEGYYGRGEGVSKSALAAGDRVNLHGEIAVLAHGCSTTGFSPTFNVRYVRIRAARAATH
jgi:hypothetical protein